MRSEKQVVLGVTGSIAAYKAAELVRLMMDRAWSVSVMMTESATRYVGPLTFRALTGRPVATGRFEQLDATSFPHIDLGGTADVVVVAPCTANVMAKIACGIADDLVTATVLASAAPLVLAPAMNTRMWDNPATRENRERLVGRGVTVLEVGQGELACGMVGAGRLPEPATIVEAVAAQLA